MWRVRKHKVWSMQVKGKQGPRAHGIYEGLKERIINLELLAGQPLAEETIAEEFEVSRTPVRQALQRLANEHFLTIIPYVGCTVRQMEVADIEEIYTTREALEGFCVNRATPVISQENLDLIEADIHKTLAYCRCGNTAATVPSQHDLLHAIALDVGGNKRIHQMMVSLNDQARWCHNLALSLPGRLEKSSEEHLRVLEAMKLRDADAAEKMMRLHLRSTLSDMITSFLNARTYTHSR